MERWGKFTPTLQIAQKDATAEENLPKNRTLACHCETAEKGNDWSVILKSSPAVFCFGSKHFKILPLWFEYLFQNDP